MSRIDVDPSYSEDPFAGAEESGARPSDPSSTR
jgi:hypothetical protein